MPSGALQLLGLLVSHALQRPSMSIGPRSTPNGTYRPRFGVRVRITADMFPSSRPHSVSRFRLPSHSCRPSAVTLFGVVPYQHCVFVPFILECLLTLATLFNVAATQ